MTIFMGLCVIPQKQLCDITKDMEDFEPPCPNPQQGTAIAMPVPLDPGVPVPLDHRMVWAPLSKFCRFVVTLRLIIIGITIFK